MSTFKQLALTFGAVAISTAGLGFWLANPIKSSSEFGKALNSIVNYTTFVSILSVVGVVPVIAADTAAKRLFGVLSLFVFWVCSAILFTQRLAGGLDCGVNSNYLCWRLNAMEAFSWIEIALLLGMLIAIRIESEDHVERIAMEIVSLTVFPFFLSSAITFSLTLSVAILSGWKYSDPFILYTIGASGITLVFTIIILICTAVREWDQWDLVATRFNRTTILCLLLSLSWVVAAAYTTISLQGMLSCSNSVLGHSICNIMKVVQAFLWIGTILWVYMWLRFLRSGIPVPFRAARRNTRNRLAALLPLFSSQEKKNSLSSSETWIPPIQIPPSCFFSGTHELVRPKPLGEMTLHIGNVDGKECQICYDTAARMETCLLDSCQHVLCRPCLAQYISTKVEEKQVPICCPVCEAEDKPNLLAFGAGALQALGFQQSDIDTFIALTMQSISLPLTCPKCTHEFSVDREDFSRLSIIGCPLPACKHIWCKFCRQEIPFGYVGEHTCDGSSELKALMTEKGWKFCPACRAPHEKVSGCNHITCTAQGCSAHYCFKCGKIMTTSKNRQEISNAVQKHSC